MSVFLAHIKRECSINPFNSAVVTEDMLAPAKESSVEGLTQFWKMRWKMYQKHHRLLAH